MQPFNAIVKKGRLTLDEPCTFAEGEVVVLLPLNDLLAAADSFGGGGDGSGLMFEISSPTAAPGAQFSRPVASSEREWRKATTRIDASALIDELRSI